MPPVGAGKAFWSRRDCSSFGRAISRNAAATYMWVWVGVVSAGVGVGVGVVF